MQRYIVRRLIIAVFILFVLSIVVFLLLRVAPGDARLFKCPPPCPKVQLEAIGERLGLNDPYWPVSVHFRWLGPPGISFHRDNQYGTWMKGLVTGSLGTSNEGLPIFPEIKRRLPTTIELLIITMIVTVAVGVPFGVISAVYRNSLGDYLARVTAIFGLSIPSFWLATMILVFPQTLWNYAPPIGRTVDFFDNPVDNLRQFGPPAIALAAALAAGIMRLTRSALLEVMRQDYIRTARSKGLQERVVVARHALKNSMIPVVTVLGLQAAALLGGAVIIEQIFSLQGVGAYYFRALFTKDYQVAQTLTLYVGAVVVLMNLMVDVTYAWLDPRIRYS